jgi:hypothetical protein
MSPRSLEIGINPLSAALVADPPAATASVEDVAALALAAVAAAPESPRVVSANDADPALVLFGGLERSSPGRASLSANSDQQHMRGQRRADSLSARTASVLRYSPRGSTRTSSLAAALDASDGPAPSAGGDPCPDRPSPPP